MENDSVEKEKSLPLKVEKEPPPEVEKSVPQPDVVEPKIKPNTPEPTIVIEPPSPVSRTQNEADSNREEPAVTPDVVPRDIGKPPVSPRMEDDG